MPFKEIKLPKNLGMKPLAMEYKFQTDWAIIKPPAKSMKDCPRCGKSHPIEAKKFQNPMTFYAPQPQPAPEPVVKTKAKKKAKKVPPVPPAPPKAYASSTYWAFCPKTKDPIVLFDVVISKHNYELFLQSDYIKTLTSKADKSFLADVKRMAERSESIVKISMTPTAAWVARWENEKKPKAKKRA